VRCYLLFRSFIHKDKVSLPLRTTSPELQHYNQQEILQGDPFQDHALHRQGTDRSEFGWAFVFSRPGSTVTPHRCIQRIYAGEENYKAVKHIVGPSWHHINQENGAQRVCDAKGKL